eukprot:1159809-Pelagomonas_calceolata.AAC.6
MGLGSNAHAHYIAVAGCRGIATQEGAEKNCFYASCSGNLGLGVCGGLGWLAATPERETVIQLCFLTLLIVAAQAQRAAFGRKIWRMYWAGCRVELLNWASSRLFWAAAAHLKGEVSGLIQLIDTLGVGGGGPGFIQLAEDQPCLAAAAAAAAAHVPHMLPMRQCNTNHRETGGTREQSLFTGSALPVWLLLLMSTMQHGILSSANAPKKSGNMKIWLIWACLAAVTAQAATMLTRLEVTKPDRYGWTAAACKLVHTYRHTDKDTECFLHLRMHACVRKHAFTPIATLTHLLPLHAPPKHCCCPALLP